MLTERICTGEGMEEGYELLSGIRRVPEALIARGH